MVKELKIFIYVKKKDLFGCFRLEEIRDKDNATGLKEGGGLEIRNYSAPFACRSIRFVVTYLQVYRR